MLVGRGSSPSLETVFFTTASTGQKRRYYAKNQTFLPPKTETKQAGLRRGVRFVIFTCAEMDVLRLSAWCKDLPADNTELLPQDAIRLLLSLGLLRQSRCGLSYRPTPAGYSLLKEAGFSYEEDKQYRGAGPALTRRLGTSSITAFLWRYGADVFRTSPGVEPDMPTFLPSFALRRQAGANVLGGTRMAGFLYTESTVFIPYYVIPESEGIYAEVEQRTFRSESLLCGRTPFVLYTGAGRLEQILETVTAPRHRKEKSTTDTYPDALDKFRCPAGIVPLKEDGLRQLRMMSVPGYRQKLIHRILGKDYLPPVNGQSDGRCKSTGEEYLIGIDCHIKRFESLITTKGGSTAHIILLSTQAAAVQQYLKGRSAVLHPISPDIAEQILGLPQQLPRPDRSPFQTGEGRYLYAPSFG